MLSFDFSFLFPILFFPIVNGADADYIDDIMMMMIVIHLSVLFLFFAAGKTAEHKRADGPRFGGAKKTSRTVWRLEQHSQLYFPVS